MRLAILMSLVAALIAGCTMPIAATTVKPKSGTVLFKDDFSSPVSGWDHTQYEQGVSDYYGGAYRILVNALDLNIWSTPHRSYADVRIEVDAGKLSGPDENRIGVICRSDGRNFYFFIVSSDGYYGLGLFQNGQTNLLGQDQMQRSDAIRTGMAVNHLRLDCSGEELSAYANGSLLAKAKDASLKQGDIGVLAGTFKKTGADIVFDNFLVLAP
jgi:hypothetical protein